MFLGSYIQTVTRELDTLRDNCVGTGFATASCQSSYQTNTEDVVFSKMTLLSVLCGMKIAKGQSRKGDEWPQKWHRGSMCSTTTHAASQLLSAIE